MSGSRHGDDSAAEGANGAFRACNLENVLISFGTAMGALVPLGEIDGNAIYNAAVLAKASPERRVARYYNRFVTLPA